MKSSGIFLDVFYRKCYYISKKIRFFYLSSDEIMEFLKYFPCDKCLVSGKYNTKNYGGGTVKPNELRAYNAFLHTGKVEDYLKYINTMQTAESTQGAVVTGESSAYHDERDRAAGATG